MSECELAKDVLNEIDERIKLIEDRELTRTERWKRRYLSGRWFSGYVIGGNVTLGQVTVGKSFWAWFTANVPSVAIPINKTFSAISAVFVGAWDFTVSLLT